MAQAYKPIQGSLDAWMWICEDESEGAYDEGVKHTCHLLPRRIYDKLRMIAEVRNPEGEISRVILDCRGPFGIPHYPTEEAAIADLNFALGSAG